MEINNIITTINESLKGKVVEVINPADRRIFVKVEKSNLLEVIKFLRDTFGFTHLSTITGLDIGTSFELLYHFSGPGAVLTVRALTDKDNPVLPSICSVIPGAILYEREIQDMFGIKIDNIPDSRPLVLPDDWEPGNYPLRKDWKFERKPEVIPSKKRVDGLKG